MGTTSDIGSIPGIGRDTRELLEAAGFIDVASLAKAGVDDLLRELQRANQMLNILKRTPSADSVRKWIAEARKNLGLEEVPVVESVMPVNYEATPQVMELLAVAPFAIPLPARRLIDMQLAVSDIPPAILLNRYSGDLEIRVANRDPGQRALQNVLTKSPARSQASSNYVQLAESNQQRLEIDTSRLRSIADLEKVGERVPGTRGSSASVSARESEMVALIRAPLEKTNRGRDPRSNFYVRGVLHTHPKSVMAGAIITLILMVLLPVAIVSSLLLLLSDQYPTTFPWVSSWLLVLPCSVPVMGFFYLIFGLSGRCRICTQRLFFPRGCLKNAKAHHVRGLGYIIPLCLHMLAFRWFRCTYCGTPVRLKK